MANWRDLWGASNSPSVSSLRFRPRLDTLDERALPDGGPVNPPPDQPPADPAPATTTEIDLLPGT